jgi:hypothetical protein
MNATYPGEIVIPQDLSKPPGEPISTTIASSPTRLPRRDLIVLPLLSILTITLLLFGSEVAARHFFPESSGGDPCRVADATIGFKYRPNCTSRVKSAEGPWVVNHYNECGYRTTESCGPKPSRTMRIALIGSSVAQGSYVGYDEIWATRAARDLTRMCRRPVEVQNLGREVCLPICEFHRIDEALALKPDLAVMTVSPYDLEHLVPSDIPDVSNPLQQRPASTAAPETLSPLKRAQNLVTESRAVTVAEHYLFQDPSTYMRIYLAYGDKADFLRTPFSPLWEARLEGFDLLLREIAEKFHAAHVPFALIEMPSLAQVSVLALKSPPPGIDPYALNQRLEEISSRHGVQFINVLDSFRRTPGSNKLFYMVDGHLDGKGQVLVSAPFVDQLTQGTTPALSGCSATAPEQSVSERF